MIGRKLFVLTGLILFLSAGSEAQGRGSSLKKASQISVKTGYIDAHFAVSPNGRTLAYLHVGEGKSPTFLNFVALGGGTRGIARVNITKVTVAPVQLYFTPDSKRLVLVSELQARAHNPPRQAAFYELTGRAAGKVTNFHELVYRKVKTGWQIVTYLRDARGQSVFHAVTQYDAKTLRRGKFARLVSKVSGEVAQPKMNIAYWTPDFTRVVVRVAGAYDRKRDVRLPDREKIYDPFTRKFASDREIEDLREWDSIQKIREKHQVQRHLLRIDGTQKAFTWEMIDVQNRRVALSDTTPPLKRFNFNSFNQRATYGKTVLFSFTVDPQWPTLFGQRRNVPEVFHLFRLDVTSKQSTLLGTIPSPQRLLAWRLGGTKLVIMRMHKYWGLGEKVIEIYNVPAAK
ncbi:MAG: hypothetical protein ABI333_01250 [bacterium]